MKRYESLKDVQDALDAGIDVFWANTSYKVHWTTPHETSLRDTERNGKVIRVTCESNGFGSLLGQNEVTSCFSK